MGEGTSGLRTRPRVVYYLLVSILLTAVLQFSGHVLANPVAVEEPPTIFLIFAYLLIALNLPVNLLIFSVALLVISVVRGTKVGALQSSKRWYVWSIILTMLVVSTAGAFIDLLLVYAAYDVDILPGADSEAVRWALATALIFLSVLLPSHFLIGLKRESNLFTAAALSLANPIIWYMAYPWDTGVDGALAVITFGAILSGMVLGLLGAWYEKVYSPVPTVPPRLRVRSLFRISVAYFTVIVLAFALSTAVWGIRSESHPYPYTALTKQYDAWTDSWKFTAAGVYPEEIRWDDISVRLAVTDGDWGVVWENLSASDLTGTTAVMHNFGTEDLGVLEASLTIWDYAGDGSLGMGDRLVLTSTDFPEDVMFTITLIYEPMDLNMAQTDFGL